MLLVSNRPALFVSVGILSVASIVYFVGRPNILTAAVAIASHSAIACILFWVKDEDSGDQKNKRRLLPLYAILSAVLVPLMIAQFFSFFWNENTLHTILAWLFFVTFPLWICSVLITEHFLYARAKSENMRATNKLVHLIVMIGLVASVLVLFFVS